MKMNILKRFFFCLVLVFSVGFQSTAESFRIHHLFPVTFSDNNITEQTVTTGINDSIAIFIPSDLTYLEGIEIKMQIPESVAEWRDSIACSLYEKITPVPDESKIDYTGTRTFVATLPVRVSWTFQIPLKKNNTLKTSPYAEKLNILPDVSQKMIFVRLQPAMKGIPEEMQNAELKISIKPLLVSKGRLRIMTKAPENKPYTVFVDQQQVTLEKTGIIIDTGIHNVTIVSDFYRNETRTVRVDQAKTTDLLIVLKSIEPTLLITAPDNTTVFIDDEPCTKIGSEFTISEGDHKIKFLIGDYEIIRNLTVQKGKSYTAALSVDLNISEE
jgi:hypothetical protein